MINKDQYYIGLLLGVLSPVLFYLVLLGVDALYEELLGKAMVRAPHYLYLLAVVPNLFWIRYYLGKMKMTKSGFSVFLVTMIYILLYFFKYFQNPV
jgi:hypothetical protein